MNVQKAIPSNLSVQEVSHHVQKKNFLIDNKDIKSDFCESVFHDSPMDVIFHQETIEINQEEDPFLDETVKDILSFLCKEEGEIIIKQNHVNSAGVGLSPLCVPKSNPLAVALQVKPRDVLANPQKASGDPSKEYLEKVYDQVCEKFKQFFREKLTRPLLKHQIKDQNPIQNQNIVNIRNSYKKPSNANLASGSNIQKISFGKFFPRMIHKSELTNNLEQQIKSALKQSSASPLRKVNDAYVPSTKNKPKSVPAKVQPMFGVQKKKQTATPLTQTNALPFQPKWNFCTKPPLKQIDKITSNCGRVHHAHPWR